MFWLLPAFAALFLFAGSNALDSRLVNRHFRSVATLVFCGCLIAAAFLPLTLLAGVPKVPSLGHLALLAVVGALEVAYLYPYYLALRHEDSSVVVALFALGDLFVPLLSYLFLGERLHPAQYLGFLVIVAGSVGLTWRPGSRVRSGRALLLMLAVSLILAVDYVVYKHALGAVDWATGFFWSRAFSLVAALPLLLLRSVRRDLREWGSGLRAALPLFGAEELMNFFGAAAWTIAFSLAPLTVVKGVGATGPLVVILYAAVLGRWFPNFFREQLDRRNIVGKVAISVVMIVGVVLVVG